MNKSKNQNKYKNKKNNKNKAIFVKKIKIIMTFTILLTIIIGLVILFFVSDLFAITQIDISGNNQINQEQIMLLSSINLNDNILLLSKHRVEKSIKENPYIKEVTIKKKLPDKIEIVIEEREKSFVLRTSKEYVYIDTQGYILQTSNDKINKPIIYGYETNEEELIEGKRLNDSDLDNLGTILKIIESSKKIDISDKITYINIKEGKFILYLESENKLIYLGNCSNLANRMLYAKDILDKEKEKQGKIFVDGNFSNGFLPYFREETNEVINN